MNLLNKTVYSTVFVHRGESKVVKQVKKALYVEARNEIKLLRKMKHSPYVVDIDFTYENEESIYMVMEYCKHGCMYDSHTILKEHRLRQVITAMLMCIYDCHKNMIIHGDIKLTNFVVDSRMNTKLIDFGCSAEVANVNESFECNQATWYYAAPENMKSIKYMQSDMWGLGVCAYVLATGQHPYQNGKGINIWSAQRFGTAFNMTAFNIENKYWNNLSTDCQDFITRLLEFEHTSRMSSDDAIYHPFITNSLPI